MPRRRRPVALLITALALAIPAAAGAQGAADPVALAKAKELIQISNLVAMRDQMVVLVEGRIADIVRDANPGEDDKVGRAVKDVIRPALKQRIPEYLDLAAGVYANHFTRAELEQLVAFYKSPVGKKLVREQGELVPDITQMSRDWINRVGNEVLKDAATEFAKRGLKAPGA